MPGSRFPVIATQRPPDASVAGQPKAANAPGKERPQEAAPVVVGPPAAEERSQVAALSSSQDVDLSPSSLREMEEARERIRESREMHNELRRLSATSITF